MDTSTEDKNSFKEEKIREKAVPPIEETNKEVGEKVETVVPLPCEENGEKVSGNVLVSSENEVGTIREKATSPLEENGEENDEKVGEAAINVREENDEKVLESQEKDIVSDTEEEEEEEEEEEGKSSQVNTWIFTIFLVVCGFVLGGVVAAFLTLRFVDTRENVSELEGGVGEKEVILVQEVDNSIGLLLQEGINFENSASDMLAIYPNLLAMSEEGNHYGLFESGLDISIKLVELTGSVEEEIRIPVGHIFYFFDNNDTLRSVEYVISSLEEENEKMEEMVSALSERYTLLESTDAYYLWEGKDGYIGFHREQLFFYLTQEEELVGQILK